MDYCYTCRRILNGALMCPGCGACAPDIDEASARPGARFNGSYAAAAPYDRAAPYDTASAFDAAPPYAAAGFDAAPAFDAVAAFDAAPAGTAPYGRGPATAADGGDPASEQDPKLAPTLHRGRAARRRQVARWKKSRRRAGVATAVALFGGGVTVASMEGTSGRGGSTSASHYDTVAPISLRTANGDQGAPGTGDPAGTPAHTTAAAHRHGGPTSPALPGTQATHPGTDSAGTTPITSGNGSGAPAYHQHAQPSTTQAPSSYTGTSGSGSSGTSGTSGTSASGSGSGSSGTTSDSGTGSGSTTASGSGGGGTTTGSGSGTQTGSGTTTPPPATGTSPSTPPPQHGLCLLVLCID